MATKNIVKRPRGARANKAQIELLVSYMASHPGFAAGAQMGYDGTRTKEEMWAEVTGQLNALGGHKSAEQWQTTWRDIKSKSCQHASSIRRARALTGGRPVEEKPLSELEKIIVSTTGTVYWEGGTTPDTLPEDSELQSQLVNGEVGVLDLEPNTLSIAETLSLPPIGFRHDVSGVEDQEENMKEEEEDVGLQPQNHPHAKSAQPQSEPEPQPGCSWMPDRATPKSCTAKKAVGRDRVSVQMAHARSNFETLAGNQCSTMRMFAEAAQKQADAAEKQADAALLQAENERRRLDLQERQLSLQEQSQWDVQAPLLAAIEQLKAVVAELSSKLQ